MPNKKFPSKLHHSILKDKIEKDNAIIIDTEEKLLEVFGSTEEPYEGAIMKPKTLFGFTLVGAKDD